MPPNTDRHESSLGFKYPKRRDEPWKCPDKWLEDKRDDDGAEGLWRIDDDLYDLSDFIDRHPGGRMWLEDTKGTDITEAFETHHLSDIPDKILPKYYVKKAKMPRNSPFTFHDDGFYRTLKKEVVEVLKTLPKREIARRSHLITDCLCFGTFLFAIIACRYWSYPIAIVSGILLAITTISAHNYFHQKDSFRMHYFDLSMMQLRDWRITHALSHHLFPNTIIDLEISLNEPIVQYMPKRKSLLNKLLLFIAPPFMWIILFHSQFLRRMIYAVVHQTSDHLRSTDLVPLILPTFMYIFGHRSLIDTILMWQFVVIAGSCWFGAVGFNAAHHHPEIFHDGDAPRDSERDFGIHQLDAVSDRHEIANSHFIVLTNFGDHALHHLFPTLDHGLLIHLYPTFHKICKQFNVEFRVKSQLEMIKGQFQQSINETPNSLPPGAKK